MANQFQTNASAAGTFIRRMGDTVIQYSAFAKDLGGGTYDVFLAGEQVVLDVNGEIIKRATADDRVFGTVLVPNSIVNEQRITVMTQGHSIVHMGSTAAIVTGDYITSVGVNTTVIPNRPNAVFTTVGKHADGMALTTASGANEDIEVLVFTSSIVRLT